jgi:GNAT superfamily N-acetyltransferase
VTVWQSEPLTPDHEVGGFDCGVGILNQWLVQQALRFQTEDLARTYVWTAPDSARVVAYYSISPTQLRRREVTDGQAVGASAVPAYLLSRLALTRHLQGQGLGSELLVDALGTIVHAATIAGGRLIVVDAPNEKAAAFYRHHDFSRVLEDPRRFVLKVATARQALDVSEVDGTDSPWATR